MSDDNWLAAMSRYSGEPEGFHRLIGGAPEHMRQLTREVAKLIIRGLAQGRTHSDRAAMLDVLDELLLLGAYGLDDVIAESERQQRS